MKAVIITLTCFLLITHSVSAQYARYLTSGSIEYEKSVNTFAILKKIIGANTNGLGQTLLDQTFKQQHFKILKSTLIFNAEKTIFTPITDESASAGALSKFPLVEQRNTIYTDRYKYEYQSKGFFEETFLIKDSVRKINWKITNETREIVGYTCRRANAIILDSVYVVAFYTNEIHVSGGPESFNGLPGMILEVALPHNNVIWRATKVNNTAIPAATIKPAEKGKLVNKREFMKVYNSIIQNLGTGQSAEMAKLDYLL